MFFFIKINLIYCNTKCNQVAKKNQNFSLNAQRFLKCFLYCYQCLQFVFDSLKHRSKGVNQTTMFERNKVFTLVWLLYSQSARWSAVCSALTPPSLYTWLTDKNLNLISSWLRFNRMIGYQLVWSIDWCMLYRQVCWLGFLWANTPTGMLARFSMGEHPNRYAG